MERRHDGRRRWAAGEFRRVRNPCLKTQCKGNNNRRKVLNILKFPTTDGTVKLSGRDYGVREFALTRDQLARSEELSGDLQGSSDKSQPIGETKDDAEARIDFLVNRRGFHTIVITSNLEFSSTCRKKKHSQKPLKYSDAGRTTRTNVDVLPESLIDD